MAKKYFFSLKIFFHSSTALVDFSSTPPSSWCAALIQSSTFERFTNLSIPFSLDFLNFPNQFLTQKFSLVSQKKFSAPQFMREHLREKWVWKVFSAHKREFSLWKFFWFTVDYYLKWIFFGLLRFSCPIIHFLCFIIAFNLLRKLISTYFYFHEFQLADFYILFWTLFYCCGENSSDQFNINLGLNWSEVFQSKIDTKNLAYHNDIWDGINYY